MSHQFQPEKVIASIGYLVQQTGADLYSVMKMIYLADKAHLSRYGRTITGDMYTAMSKGPVPERAYNLCKYVRGDRERFDPMPDAKHYLDLVDNNFDLLVAPDLEELSESDVEALNEVAAIHRRGGWKAVFDASHDAAWRDAWGKAQASGVGSIPMSLDDIAGATGDAALVAFLQDPHPGCAPAPTSH